ncbi:putative reverse transcriptase domain-containing protein [Tanacetum coccineum]
MWFWAWFREAVLFGQGVVGKVLGQLQVPHLGISFVCWLLFGYKFLVYLLTSCCVALLLVLSIAGSYMAIVRFHCPFAGLSGCHDGGGNGLTKTSLITHLRDRHCNGDAQATTKHALLTDLVLDLVDGLLHDQHDGFTLSLLDSLFSKGLRTVKSIPPKCRLGFSRVLKGALNKVICKPDDISCWVSLLVLPLCLLKTFRPRSNLECKSANKRQCQEESITNAIRSWGVPGGSWQLVRETLTESASPMLDLDEENLDLSERNLKQCKRKICDGHYTAAVRVLSSSGVAPYNDATLQELKAKHPFKSAPSLPDIPIDHHQLIASQDVVLDRIKSFPRGTSCGRDGLRAQHLMDCLSGAAVAISDELVSSITQVVNLFLEGKCPMMLGEYIASAPLTPLIKPGGGIRPIVVGTVWRRLVSKDRGDDVGLSMLLVDFQNAFNLVDQTVMLEEVRLRCPAISRWVEFCYSSPARLYYGEHFLWSSQGVQQGDPLGPLLFYLVLHPLICKIRDSFNLCLQAWYLDDGTIVGDTLVVGKVLELITEDGPRRDLHLNVDKTELFWPKEDPRSSVDADFSSALVMKRVSKTIGLLDTVAKINDPQCDVLNYAFIASRLQSTALQTKLLRHVDIVAIGSTFDDALCMFNNAMGIDFLSNSSQVAAPKLMKKMADIYFTQVTKDVESSFCLSPRQMALWQSQRGEHTSDWLRVVSISRLGQTMNGKTYRCVLCYRLGVPLFSVSKPCSACSKVFTGDVYGDHVVSCAGVIGIKH